MSDKTGAGESPVTRVDIPAGQGVLVGEGGKQDNKFFQINIQQPIVQAPIAPAAWHVVAGEVPQSPSAFQPRAGLLAALRDSGPGWSVVRSVTGMRGVGKTQVAAAYARACIDEDWRLVAWINAENLAQVLGGLAVVAARMGLGAPDAGVEDVARLVRNQLEADGERCLMVLDNLADLDGVRPFLPAAGKSQVVVTSTEQAAAGLGRAVPVDVFTEEEALTFLGQRTRRADHDGAAELALELGYLPLALAQAAAVIAAQRLDYGKYLGRLRSLPVEEYLTPTVGEPYPRGVAQAVLLSLNAVAIADQTGLCTGLIDVVSLLSPAGVPRALLYTAEPAGAFSEAGQEQTTADLWKIEQDVDEALGKLADASLLTFSRDESAVSTHRLIMRVVRERRAREGALAAVGRRTCDLLSAHIESLDQHRQNRPVARNTIQHVIASNDHLTPHIRDEDAALKERLLALRRWALRCLNDLRDSFTRAVEYGQALVADSEQFLGPTDPDTLTSRNELANAYRAAKRLDEAIALHKSTLADREQVLDPTHPDTLTSRNDLARAYRAAGRLDEAIPLYERTLTDREQVQGPTHADTLSARGNLADAYRDADRLDEAIALHKSTLADREQVLDPTHPDTLTSRNDLARAYQVAGRLDEAIPLYERTLTDRERVLGPTHSKTLRSRHNLARAYQAVGRLDEAIPLYERTLADRERVLGPVHPETLSSGNNLAAAYQAAGRLDEAIPLYERTLAGAEQSTHPDSRTFSNNLADAYRAAARLADATIVPEQSGSDEEIEPLPPDP